MHLARISPNHTTAIILAESQEVLLNPKNDKSEGYGGVLSIGLVLLAVIVTILFFFRSRSRNISDNRTPGDRQQDALGEPDDHDLKMR